MDDKHSAANCRWAKPTLFLPPPFWLEAWNCPWTCTRDEISNCSRRPSRVPAARAGNRAHLDEARQPPVRQTHEGQIILFHFCFCRRHHD